MALIFDSLVSFLIPNKTTRLHYNNYDYILKTNSLGLAAPELLSEKPSPGTTRILVVGDAFSMPEGVEYENAYPALLETILNKTTDNKKVEVINGGVTGYGPVEQNVQIKELVPQLKPHIVVYQFFINEFQEAHIAPETRHQNIGFTTLPFRQQILSQSQIKEYLYIFRNKFAGMIKNKPSQKRYWKALLPFYEKENNEYYEQSKLDIVENYLMQMSDVCKQNRAKMVIYFVPAAIAVSKPEYISYYPWNQDVLDRSRFDFNLPFQHLQKMGKDLDIPVVDLTPELKKYHDQPVYFPGSWHWNAKGHKVAAKSCELGQKESRS